VNAARLRTIEPSQRALTEGAGERIAEFLHWRTDDQFDFAVVIYPRNGDGKATTYTSRNDAALATKISAAVVNHD
jgi:hypothetical protein